MFLYLLTRKMWLSSCIDWKIFKIPIFKLGPYVCFLSLAKSICTFTHTCVYTYTYIHGIQLHWCVFVLYMYVFTQSTHVIHAYAWAFNMHIDWNVRKWGKFPYVLTEQHSYLYYRLLICVELVSICIVLRTWASTWVFHKYWLAFF